MRKHCKKIISYILLITLVFTIIGDKNPVLADENIDEGKCGINTYYVLDSNGTLTISGKGKVTNNNWIDFKEQIKKVIIEEGVINIPFKSFYGCSNLIEASMANSVQEMGSSAFRDCVALEEITFSKKIKVIPDYAFQKCTNLQKIIIPDNVKEIQDEVFYGCTKLKDIQMSKKIENVKKGAFINTAFFKNDDNWKNGVLYCDSVLVSSNTDVSRNVTVREGTRVIAAEAFENSRLSKVILPESMITIGDYAFYYCKLLQEIVAEPGLRYIEEYAFNGDSLLSKVQLPDTVEKIERAAFAECERIVNFNTPSHLTKIGNEAFVGCGSLESFTIPKSVSIIGDRCFDNCNQLLEITSYTTAAPGSFKGWGTMSLPDSVRKIRGIKLSDYENYAKKKGISFEEVEDWEICEMKNEYGKAVTTKGQKAYQNTFLDSGVTYVDYANTSYNKMANASPSEIYNNANNVLDGKMDTYWTNNGDETTFTIDLGRNITFNQIKIWMRGLGLEYEISVSTDNLYFEQIMHMTNSYNSTRTDEIVLNSAVTGRYVHIKRLYIRDPGDLYYEIGLYGKEGQLGEGTEETTNSGQVETIIAPTTKGNVTTTMAPTIPTESEVTTVVPTTPAESEVTTVVPTTPHESEATTVVPTTPSESVVTTVAPTTPPESEVTTITPTTSLINEKNITTTKQQETTAVGVESNKNTDPGIQEKLIVPKIKSIKESNYHTALIKWNKSAIDCRYEIYRGKKKGGKYIKIAGTSKTEFADKKVKAGKRYFYKIKAISKNESVMSNIKDIRIKGKPNRPGIKVKADKVKLEIKWGIIKDNSKGIEIFVKSLNGGYKKYKKIHSSTNLKKSKNKKGVTGIISPSSGLKSGVTYQFKSRTYAVVMKHKVYSRWSKIRKIKI